MDVHFHDGTSTPALFMWLSILLGTATGTLNLIIHRGRLGILALVVGATSTGLGGQAAYQQSSANGTRYYHELPDFLISTGTLSTLHMGTALATIILGFYLTGQSSGKPKTVSASLNALFLLVFLVSLLGSLQSFWALII